MSKKSFSEIEQAVKNAAEAYEPAFDEQAWKKMEALLDKEKDRKKPFFFRLWWLLPLLIGAGVVGYFSNNKNKIQTELAVQKNSHVDEKKTKNIINTTGKNAGLPDSSAVTQNISHDAKNKTVHQNSSENKTGPDNKDSETGLVNKNKTFFKDKTKNRNVKEAVFNAGKPAGNIKGKTTVAITPASPESDEEKELITDKASASGSADKPKQAEQAAEITNPVTRPGETGVIAVDAGKLNEKEIEKIIDSVITKTLTGKRSKARISKFYVIVAGGAEASGVKLFSADKITSRYGAALGFQINKKISVQSGFFASNKKYRAGKEDYQAKAGSYWAIVDIKSIDANCRVYEIPLQVRYDFLPGKKLNIFATAGLSSYIMKKENYNMYYERYGTMHEADVLYTGNNGFFSVLRFSAGAEKKISGRFAVFASPGIAVPLAGVGEGKVKLYSTDMMLGLKFTPSKKNK
jgi:hypothetical protein